MWERTKDSTAHATAPTSVLQLRLMYVIDRHDGVKMRTVCDLLASTPPNVSRMCDRLQTLGFLQRTPRPDNGREIILRLSPAGKAHLKNVRDQRESMLHDAIHNMPPAERHALAAGLAGLQAQLTTPAAHRSGTHCAT